MGRGRGKGKKQSPIAREDSASFEDEKLPMKRRGRPLKAMKDELEDDDEFEKIGGGEEVGYENGENEKGSDAGKNGKNGAFIENGKKRKRPLQEDDQDLAVREENGSALNKNVGYRQNGSRRKSKPRRAAEVGVECK
ncbi:metal tolerance protein [Striga asiatica]|uniref:Metal tolerance protein n=1 Tax=Striga asiatica TaxID=4170 RepID=A0A5A7Q450_STRAF|nr:metal tolerance protein [Striga asiatica]